MAESAFSYFIPFVFYLCACVLQMCSKFFFVYFLLIRTNIHCTHSHSSSVGVGSCWF
ncbi:Uncharacterized protein APZ42_032811 [Daphnia magna]|uniref:Uncharacterized protein n=1 Tax=Daphnia magna TaxID=35525 RepID=A0A164LWL4_9CRUS|nr:Uncharacterized protein APZ42_032811 [Daphnia magna]